MTDTITLTFDAAWEYTIAGETFAVDATKIPAATWIAVVKDRLLNKGRDTWADSTKVTTENTRQDLWAGAMASVYAGDWLPGTGKGRGPNKKSMTWESFLEAASRKEAKRRIGKLGFRGTDGYWFKPDDKESMDECTNRLVDNVKWQAKVKLDYDNRNVPDDLDL
jgi:hypothetical protein